MSNVRKTMDTSFDDHGNEGPSPIFSSPPTITSLNLDSSMKKILFDDTFLVQFVNRLEPFITRTIQNSIDELKVEVKSLQEENVKLKNELKEKDKVINDLKASGKNLESELEKLEQYGRRNSLRFYHMPLGANTDDIICEIVKNHLHINLTPQDIDISHPLGPPKDGTQSIIVRFTHRRKRNEILKKKKLFSTRASKGPHDLRTPNPNKIYVTEDLTRPRQFVVRRLGLLRYKKLISSYWTEDGDIIVKKGEEDENCIRINIVKTNKDVDFQLGYADLKFDD